MLQGPKLVKRKPQKHAGTMALHNLSLSSSLRQSSAASVGLCFRSAGRQLLILEAGTTVPSRNYLGEGEGGGAG